MTKRKMIQKRMIRKVNNDRIPMIILSFILGLFLFGCDTQKKLLIREGKIPKDCKFIGGKDGGYYVLIIESPNNSIEITFYNSWTGDKIKKFEYRNTCNYKLSSREIFKRIDAFDGIKIIWGNNKKIVCLVE